METSRRENPQRISRPKKKGASPISKSIKNKPTQKDLTDCPWCGGITRPVKKDDTYQCGRCKRRIS
tara:strand:+ start:104 stop:301 length:198 start_codon:yes stop_codon:yes gene_type:complete